MIQHAAIYDYEHILHTQLETLRHFLWADYNLELDEKLRLCYPNWDKMHVGYRSEKQKLMQRGGLGRVFATLDQTNRLAVLRGLAKRYKFDPLDKCKSFPESA